MKKNRSDLTGTSDQQLMNLLLHSGQDAFEELYRRWAGRIRYFFLRMYRFDYEQADDRTQDVFLKVLESASSFNSNNAFAPWLYAIAYNLYKNDLRKTEIEQRFRHASATAEPWENPSVEKQIDLSHATRFVNQILEKLDPEVKSIFVLRHAAGLSIPEIAKVSHCAEGTVKSRLFYAMKKISDQVKPEKISEWL